MSRERWNGGSILEMWTYGGEEIRWGWAWWLGSPCCTAGSWWKACHTIVTVIMVITKEQARTNLDSILKSRDITLPTKVCLVKAMVFPVVMYGCESWTIKKAEHQRIDAFKLWC